MAAHFVRLSLLAGVAGMLAAPLSAQAPATASANAAKRVYAPADFARFAPKTAYDMLVQVPASRSGPRITERGLGQASENVLINGQRITDKSGGAVDQLQRTSAGNVDRIESSTPASLGIAGLAGQVANVILKIAGQGQWPVQLESELSRAFHEAAILIT